MRIPSWLKWLLYLVYALVLTTVLLYVRFPSVKFSSFLERKVEAIFTGSEADIGIVRVEIPGGMRIDRIELVDQGSAGQIAMLTDVRITPHLLGMGRSYTVGGNFNGGRIDSELSIAFQEGQVNLEGLKLNGVQLEQFEYLKDRTRREMRGSLKFSGSYTASWKDGGVQKVQGVLQVQDGSFTLKRPLLALSEMDIRQLKVGLTWSGDKITLVDGTFAGKEIGAEYSGAIEVSDESGGGTIELAGSLIPQREFLQDKPQVSRVVRRLQKQYSKSALPFRVSGSVSNPSFRFGE